MKKITLVFAALLTFGTQAQEFPFPYCEITDAADVSVEEITSVNFDGIMISNTDMSSVLVDQTNIIVSALIGATSTIEVEGNTYGDFNTDIVAFIDWNQNDILDDAGEIYEIGTITNSTGSDGVSVSMQITIPDDAAIGETRIRITKTYQDPESLAEINPCGIQFNPFGQGVFPGFGQALDFTLDIEDNFSIGDFDLNTLAVFPIPTKDVLNISYKHPINKVQIYTVLGQEVYFENSTLANLKLDLSFLNSGTYVVKLFSEQAQHNFKIVKQ
jgi:hypothetical protein